MAIKPRILLQGNDLKCVHRENIGSDNIGTCVVCGQKRDYGQNMLEQDRVAIGITLDGLVVHESTDAQRARGGQNNKRREERC